MWKFISYEWKYWLRSPMIWIFLVINTLLVLGAVSSDQVTIGGDMGSVHKNAPFVIQFYYGIMSLICLLMTTAFMNASANRDFDHNMYQFIFSSPIKKRDYYYGKFIGAVTISMLPLLGVSLGSLIGPLMPWAQPERYGDVTWNGHLLGIITFGIPNTIISAVLLYMLATLFRSNIVSFIGAMVILVLYAVSAGFTKDIEKEWLANLLDPFGFRPEGIISKYMTVVEKNAGGVALSGAFLVNRLVWMGISAVILVAGYFKFSFSAPNKKARKVKKDVLQPGSPEIANKTFLATDAGSFSLPALWYLIRFETKAIIKNPTFIIITVIGMLNLVASLSSFTGRYGTARYPVTYDVIDSVKGSFFLFLIAIITFYSGVLVWKERDAKFSEIQDSSPIQTAMLFISKLIAMVACVALTLVFTIMIGMVMQTIFGYHRYELDVYIKSLLGLSLMNFSFLIVIALFFHYLINNRYIAYFAFVAFVILNQFIWGLFRVSTNMVIFGSTPSVTYSDMNGFGPFVPSVVWFLVYWSLFSILLTCLIFSFYTRGMETGFVNRIGNARRVLWNRRLAICLAGCLFILCGGFVYYNTKVLNKYDSEKELENKQVDYEKAYKKYEGLAQPRFYKYDYAIDLMPYERSMKAVVEAYARNTSGKPIGELHFTLPQVPDSVKILIPGSRLRLDDTRLGYRIYSLNRPLQPGDSIRIIFRVSRVTRGFENEVTFTQLTQNGTFFNNTDIMPSFGYSSGYEVSDKNKRLKLKLPPRIRMAKLDDHNLATRANNYLTDDADWVEVNTVIGTAPDQVAVAPGSLVKSWESGGRRYFSYKLDKRSLDFYSFISARYEIARKRWNGIDLEVYYIREHAYNVPNMMNGMEKSLSYYTRNFGKYYHRQCRIIEFPRYSGFAQAFPGTMPYSEGIGFIVDLRNVTKDDVDLVFYVVAHEMGHQYWAHQVCGADMQGSELMSEGFAQYSALMVMEKEYGRDKMKKFLKYEMDGYLTGRSKEPEAERPLYKSEHQSYIHYQKASVAMYYLKEMIGENKVNEALRNLLDSFAYKQPPYPTSLSAVRAFRRVTPDSLQYLIGDLFENITLFSNRVTEAKVTKAGNEYLVTLKTSSEKFRADSLGKEKPVPMNDYVDIGIFTTPVSKYNLGKPLLLKRVRLTKRENVFTFRVREKPSQAGIDPYNYLIDRIPGVNLKSIEEE
ncbi:MAG: M1 family aminopeptidase [Bacteroidota bacterium]